MKTDIARWKHESHRPPDQNERNRTIARHIPAGSTVLDLGAGAQTLKQFLAPGCQYQPCDIIAGPGVLLCDFNAGDWPAIDRQYDCVVCSGVLEYVENLPGFLATVSTLGREVLMSYDSFKTGHALSARVAAGWFNHLTQVELEELFDTAGLCWEMIDTWHGQLIYRARISK